MNPDLNCHNIADLAEKARKRLPLGVWEYLERGVEDELGISRNRHALDELTFIPRIARNVENIETSSKIFGQTIPFPLAIAPTGGAGTIWHNGDFHLASAAAKAGVPFTMSSAGTMDIEELAPAGGRQWFQLYVREDRDLSYRAMQTAHEHDCDALFVTMDMAALPNREYLSHNGFGTPFTLNTRNLADLLLHPRWLTSVIARYMLTGGMPSLANLPKELKSSVTKGAHPGAHFKQSTLDWEELKVIRDRWPGKMVLKGVLHPSDAIKAMQIGADGVVVSNHGARSLDGAIASIDALPTIVSAVGEKMTVFFDSGVRRGSDIAKAVALGADCVLTGRAPLYGLATAGETGVTRAITLLNEEFRRTMAFLGTTSVDQLTPEIFS